MKRRSAGFTLIEVVVALAVLAAALYAASGSVRAAARGNAHLEETVLAHWVALNAFNTAAGAKPGAGTESPTSVAVTQYGFDFIVETVQEVPTVSATADTPGTAPSALLRVSVALAARPDTVIYQLEGPMP